MGNVGNCWWSNLWVERMENAFNNAFTRFCRRLTQLRPSTASPGITLYLSHANFLTCLGIRCTFPPVPFLLLCLFPEYSPACRSDEFYSSFWSLMCFLITDAPLTIPVGSQATQLGNTCCLGIIVFFLMLKWELWRWHCILVPWYFCLALHPHVTCILIMS